MRILLLTNVFPSPLQPLKGVFNLHLASALVEAGHDVACICPVSWVDRLSGQRRSQDFALPGISVEYPSYYFPPKVWRRSYGAWMWWSIRKTVKSVLRDFKPEAVVGYWAHPDGQCALRAARLADVPGVVMVGGSDVLLLTRNKARRRVIHDVLACADRIVTVSEDIREKLIAGGCEASKLHVIRRGVDSQAFVPGDRLAARRRLNLPALTPILLWVGRMVPVKGLEILMASLGLLRQRGLGFRACLLGGGECERALRAEARERGLEDCVQFVGSVPHAQLPDWYRAADLSVLPSFSEGVPNVLLESIACGTPFVASNVGGIPEIATTGLDSLVPPGDATALANALEERLAAASSDQQRRFVPGSWSQSAADLVNVLSSPRCISQPPAPVSLQHN